MPMDGTDYNSAFQFHIQTYQTGMNLPVSNHLELFSRSDLSSKQSSIHPRAYSLFESDGPLHFDPQTVQIVKLKENYIHLAQVEKIQLESIQTLKKTLETIQKSVEDAGNLLRKVREDLGYGRLIEDKDLDDLLLVESNYIQKLDSMQKLFSTATESKIQESQGILESISGNLNVNRELIHDFLKSIIPEEQQKINLCSICFEKEINACLNPCGHSFCKGCTEKFQNTSCPSCRVRYQSVLPLYL